eukprot:2268958-Rhodomonas_salina.1
MSCDGASACSGDSSGVRTDRRTLATRLQSHRTAPGTIAPIVLCAFQYTAKSNARKHKLSTVRTRNAFSSL